MAKECDDGQNVGCKRGLFVAAVSSSVAITVCLTIGILLLHSTNICQPRSPTGTEETFDVEIWEVNGKARVNISEQDRTIVTVTTGSKSIHSTITLQDYNKGIQAIKDTKRKQCYVLPVFASFEDIQRALLIRQKVDDETVVPVHVDLEASRQQVPAEIFPWLLGTHIDKLCSDIPTFWLTSPDRPTRVKRWNFEFEGTIFGFKISISIKAA